MGCSTCSSGGGLPKGCRGNGSCGTSGCDTLTVFDWLSDMEQPAGQKPFEWVEVRFKNGRKEFYKNVDELSLHMGDMIAVEAQPGHDVGQVSLTGELVRLQMRKKRFRQHPDQFLKVYRKANQKDLDLWTKGRERENETMLKAREIAQRLELVMKISDVEFQGDNSKATFYYTADDRVDFRQLIRELASMFRVRIEMRQIGARQEASRLGGIGSCGRELCCSTWLTDFRSVNTSAARYQQLSLNPTKLAGQCGKLKCCLNYELDSYVEALKEFPETNKRLKTQRGDAAYMKMDIFQGKMWYAYVDEAMTWVALDTSAVKEILEMNAKGEKPASLEELMAEVEVAEPDFDNVVGQDDINRFDRPQRSRNKRRKPRGNSQQGGTGQPAQNKQNAAPEAKENQKPKRSNNRNKPKGPRQKQGGQQASAENKGNAPKAQGNSNNRNKKRRRPNRNRSGNQKPNDQA
ncbi:hypothetical protein F8C67_10555 [Phaeocystidibacter luteus]|uniref:PSP1 C-terminal domain-containing protein n=2 Tax=Phaeocystidibacter luteus TaxID=911197 RepID=A0A6N6RH94_9FLAO|nr:hypothetical protein F8C67_10555 [Phaeocystidibacter luteus]